LVAETGLRRIVAVNTASGEREVLADNLPLGDPAGSPAITDVAVGPDGAIYVSSDLERTVYRLTRRP
jgi:glucose/arabinose dehydrogenase